MGNLLSLLSNPSNSSQRKSIALTQNSDGDNRMQMPPPLPAKPLAVNDNIKDSKPIVTYESNDLTNGPFTNEECASLYFTNKDCANIVVAIKKAVKCSKNSRTSYNIVNFNAFIEFLKEILGEDKTITTTYKYIDTNTRLFIFSVEQTCLV